MEINLKSYAWYKHWKSGRSRCNNKNASNYKYYGGRGIKFLLTHEEISSLWNKVDSKNFKQPQLSRKNHNKDYTYSNCYFVDKKSNVSERNSRISSKKIIQLTLKGEIIKIWNSASEVQKVLGFNRNNLTSCARGVLKTSRGFIWKYK